MKSTVFVIGAGASRDFGLPLGTELANNIRLRLEAELQGAHSFRPILDSAMSLDTGFSGERRDYGAAVKDLCGGLVSARSIDRLLDSRRDRPLVVDLGKCAIAAEIALGEQRCPIGEATEDRWESRQAGLLGTSTTWIASLFSLLHEGIAPKDASKIFSEISFVTFNYDRCIEQYLRLAFQHVMNLEYGEAVGLARAIPVVHIYGSLGELPDQNGNGRSKFGPSNDFIGEAAKSLRTFTEGADEGTLAHARSLIDRASNIVFLGFGFDPKNVDALFEKPIRKQPTLSGKQRLIGTGIGVGSIEQQYFKDKAFGDERIVFESRFPHSDCKSFIDSSLFKSVLFEN